MKKGRNIFKLIEGIFDIQRCSKRFYWPGNHKLQTKKQAKKILESESGEEYFLAIPWGVRGHLPLENFENQRSQIG